MPYTMSFATELLRIGIAQATLEHQAKQDVKIQGHTIPKGKSVAPFMSTVEKRLWHQCRAVTVHHVRLGFVPHCWLNVSDLGPVILC